MITEQLGESVVPPQIIDNSAVLFSNTKRKKGKFKRNNVQNHLQSDIDKSENEVDYQSVNDEVKMKGNQTYEDYEGEYDGEGESYSSSCSCSSCLREKNADNGVSLKLSQYSYRPTYAGYQKNATEDESQVVDLSRFQDGDTSGYAHDQSTNNLESNYNGRMEDESMGGYTPDNKQGNILELDRSLPDYPDNLNNGKFTMKKID